MRDNMEERTYPFRITGHPSTPVDGQGALWRPMGIGVLLFLLLCFFPFIQGAPSAAEQDSILVMGTSRVRGGNVAAAREAAVSVALVKGVENALLNRLGKENVIQNFSRIIKEVVPDAREVVENFHILAEEQAAEKYHIVLGVKINDKLMEEKLREAGLLLRKGVASKMLFLVSHHEGEDGAVYCWWRDPMGDMPLYTVELVLYRSFEERGFVPINRLMHFPGSESTEEMRLLQLPLDSILAWGKTFSADAVVFGRSEVVGDRRVLLNLAVYDTENGQLIYEGRDSEPFDGGNAKEEQIRVALEEAIGRISIRATPVIQAALQESTMSTKELELTVKGLKSFKQIRELKAFLQNEVEGVKAVKQSRVSGNAVALVVEFAGGERSFLEQLKAHQDLKLLGDVSQSEEGEVILSLY